jgi:hypothetical protein
MFVPKLCYFLMVDRRSRERLNLHAYMHDMCGHLVNPVQHKSLGCYSCGCQAKARSACSDGVLLRSGEVAFVRRINKGFGLYV